MFMAVDAHPTMVRRDEGQVELHIVSGSWVSSGCWERLIILAPIRNQDKI